MNPASNPNGNPGFVTTLWTVVLQAQEEDSPATKEALEKLCTIYWYPLYAYVRRSGRDFDEAQDLTQEFFYRVLQKNYLRSADRNRGRFRSFILAALKNFLANEWDRSQSQKRGGGKTLISMDATEAEHRYCLEVADALTPEKIYSRRWAQALVEQVMTRLREEYAREGKPERFDAFKAFLVEESPESQAEIGARLGMSESAVKSAMFRMRQRYGELFREEILHTVSDPSEVEAEIRELFAELGS
jgi:RNA polymerase sigma factor (sigma-70 family)